MPNGAGEMSVLEYGSACSGIESASMAWEPLGMAAAWLAEVEEFPSAVLAHHWPEVANLGDMCNLPYLVAAGLIGAPDILVGGTPCQAFSVAGLRKGLEDERGKLTLKFVELANEIDKKRDGNECLTVWENVPGVLSSKDNAFGCFLGELAGETCELKPAGGKWTNAGCVFGPQRSIAWRILDAQYFGVAQRRRRVFVIASARKGFDPQKVLFESEGVRRDIAPSRQAGQDPAKAIRGRANSSHREDSDNFITMASGQANAEILKNLAPTLNLNRDGSPILAQSVRPDGAGRGTPVIAFQTRYARNGRGGPSEIAYPLTAQAGTTGKGDSANCVAFAQNSRDEVRYQGGDGQISGALAASPGMKQTTYLADASTVRRLTPIECERLQGFPDNHTRIPFRGKPAEDCPDGHRYKACGNSKAVPVIKFIGERILRELGL
jgi:DNA (cytosine-5)-methyltransferase 1